VYWNRSLVKKWRRARANAYSPVATLAGGGVNERPQPSRFP